MKSCSLNALVAGLIVLTAWGCKPEKSDSTDVQTLGNLTKKGAEPIACYDKVNETSVSNWYEKCQQSDDKKLCQNIIGVESLGEEEKESFFNSLSSVPNNITELYLGSGGLIDLTLDKEAFDKKCEEISGGELEATKIGAEMPACWGIEDRKPKIYVRPIKLALETSLVRSAGMLFAEYYSTRKLVGAEVDGKLVAQLQKDSDAEQKQRVFLTELAKKFVQDAYKEELNADKDSDDFAWRVFGEAFDSYYCSAETQDIMKRKFPKTFCEFDKFNVDLNLADSKCTDGAPNKKESSGLMLLGGAAVQAPKANTTPNKGKSSTGYPKGVSQNSKTPSQHSVSQSPGQHPVHPGQSYPYYEDTQPAKRCGTFGCDIWESLGTAVGYLGAAYINYELTEDNYYGRSYYRGQPLPGYYGDRPYWRVYDDENCDDYRDDDDRDDRNDGRDSPYGRYDDDCERDRDYDNNNYFNNGFGYGVEENYSPGNYNSQARTDYDNSSLSSNTRYNTSNAVSKPKTNKPKRTKAQTCGTIAGQDGKFGLLWIMLMGFIPVGLISRKRWN